MSFWTDIETEYNTIIASADTVATKLENLMGLQTRAAQMTTLTAQMTSIIDDGSKDTATKVNDILALVGKA